MEYDFHIALSSAMKEENGVEHISAVIYCERKSHKGIIIGKKDDVKVIYDLFKKYEDSKNLTYGFVPLINLIDGLGCKVNKKHFNTTYKL